jgi:hypothetical protein
VSNEQTHLSLWSSLIISFEAEGIYCDLPNSRFDGNGSYTRKQLVFPLLLAGFSTGFFSLASRHLKGTGASRWTAGLP